MKNNKWGYEICSEIIKIINGDGIEILKASLENIIAIEKESTIIKHGFDGIMLYYEHGGEVFINLWDGDNEVASNCDALCNEIFDKITIAPIHVLTLSSNKEDEINGL